MSHDIVETYYNDDARINRLIKFGEDEPDSGIPDFWSWDRQLNPTPFDPEADVVVD